MVPEFVPAIDSSAPIVTMYAPIGPMSACAAEAIGVVLCERSGSADIAPSCTSA